MRARANFPMVACLLVGCAARASSPRDARVDAFAREQAEGAEPDVRAAAPAPAAPAPDATARAEDEPAEPTSPTPDGEPRFVTDPNGTDYGNGAVRSSASPSGGLSRAPSSPTGTDCNALFPPGARAASGKVTLEVDVGPSGATTASRVIDEQPSGEAFGAAAQVCARRMRFSPATDANGKPAAGRTRIRVAFQRP